MGIGRLGLGGGYQDPIGPTRRRCAAVVTMGAAELAIQSADAILAGRLPWPHKDPFDRILVAQALRRGWTIATRDARILDAALAPTLRA